MVGPITAAIDAFAIGWMGFIGFCVKSCLGFWSIVASLYTVEAVANPRATPIPAKGASELPSVTIAGLVDAVHNTIAPVPPSKSP